MNTELVVTEPQAVVAKHESIFEMEPRQQITYASKIATVLSDVIDKQKMYSSIQGKNYVKVEGWQTLGTILGITPRESRVHRLDDGSYEAFVDLIKFADGRVVGGASAICSVTEKRWAAADEYARRSMAITRATGKAYRCAFSWIITLAGYEATPEEEIPREAAAAPKAYSKPVATEIYTGTSEQQQKVKDHCLQEKIPDKHWADIDAKLMNQPFTKINVGKAVRAALGAHG